MTSPNSASKRTDSPPLTQTPPGPELTARRRDASTDLLTRVLTDALEPGYRRAAEKAATENAATEKAARQKVAADKSSEKSADKPADHSNDESLHQLNDKSTIRLRRAVWPRLDSSARDSPLRNNRARNTSVGPLVALLVVGLVLGVAFSRARADAPLAAQQQAALRARVSAASTQVAATEAELVTLRQRIDSLTAKLADPNPVREAAALAAAAALTAVRGPGVVVELDDGPPHVLTPGGADLARIQDRDLQSVVNGLWAVGAQAISISGRRLTARTAIRSAGEAILVGYRPLSPPYLVDVIGPPTMAATFRESDAGQLLIGLSAQYGIGLRISASADLTLPAGDDITLHSARPVSATGGGGGASPSTAGLSTAPVRPS